VQGAYGNASIVVTWVAPSSTGGSAIVSYTATASPGGRTCTWTSGDLRCTVTGLSNGTAYTLSVVATTGVGDSLPSDPSSAVTPLTTPGAPTGVTATAGNGTATVSWSAPSSNGGAAISSYTVTSVPAGGTCAWTSGPLTCTVTGLANGTPYTFRVTAANAEGAGVAGVSAGAVVPTAPATAQTTAAGGSGAGGVTIAAVSGLKASVVDAGSVRLSFKTGQAGARHQASCSARGGKTAAASGTTASLVVKGLSYGLSYVCDVVSSLNGVSSTVASVRVDLLADLPKPAGVSSVASARSGGSIAVRWAVPDADPWVRMTQRVELRSGSGGVLAKAFARSRAGRASAVVVVPSSAASGSYSVCVVFEDARLPKNREQVCRKAQITRPSSGGGSSGSSGSSQPSRPIGPIVL
jgi:hypothetical protein